MSNTTDPTVIFLTVLKQQLGPEYTIKKVSSELYRISTTKGGQQRATNYGIDEQSFNKHTPQQLATDLANRIKRLFPDPIPERNTDV